MSNIIDVPEITRCTGCTNGLISVLAKNDEELLIFLMEHGVILKEKFCCQCGLPCQLTREKSQSQFPRYFFRCRRVREMYNETRKKKVKVQCTFKCSIKQNTFFHNSHVSMKSVCHFVLFDVLGVDSKTMTAEREFGWARQTVIDWGSFLREVYLDWAAGVDCGKLGGPGIIVEIDESKVGKRKNNCGRVIEGQWIFGGFERETRKFFVVPVEDRSKETLLNIIKNKINDGTTIMSDCWKSYDCLSNEGFHHLKVNHSLNFIDPETDANTQSVERLWRDMKDWLPKYGRKKDHFPGYLARFLLKKYIPDHISRMHETFVAMGKLYDPEKDNQLSIFSVQEEA